MKTYYLYPKILSWSRSVTLTGTDLAVPVKIDPDFSVGFVMAFDNMEDFERFDNGEGLKPIIITRVETPVETPVKPPQLTQDASKPKTHSQVRGRRKGGRNA